MQRLQLVGPVGGLLPPEKVVLGIQQIGSSPHSTVYTSVLKLQKEQIQVQRAFAIVPRLSCQWMQKLCVFVAIPRDWQCSR